MRSILLGLSKVHSLEGVEGHPRKCVQAGEVEVGIVGLELYSALRREQEGLASADQASNERCYRYALKASHTVRTGVHWHPRVPASSGNGARVAWLAVAVAVAALSGVLLLPSAP